MNLIKENSSFLKLFCEKHKVGKLYAFGSLLTSSFNKKSDIDFAVDFEDSKIGNYASNYFDLKYALEDLFHREIDLIELDAISNPYFKEEVDETKKRLYESKSC